MPGPFPYSRPVSPARAALTHAIDSAIANGAPRYTEERGEVAPPRIASLKWREQLTAIGEAWSKSDKEVERYAVLGISRLILRVFYADGTFIDITASLTRAQR